MATRNKHFDHGRQGFDVELEADTCLWLSRARTSPPILLSTGERHPSGAQAQMPQHEENLKVAVLNWDQPGTSNSIHVPFRCQPAATVP